LAVTLDSSIGHSLTGVETACGAAASLCSAPKPCLTGLRGDAPVAVQV
jgi:hypothetical protein